MEFILYHDAYDLIIFPDSNLKFNLQLNFFFYNLYTVHQSQWKLWFAGRQKVHFSASITLQCVIPGPASQPPLRRKDLLAQICPPQIRLIA